MRTHSADRMLGRANEQEPTATQTRTFGGISLEFNLVCEALFYDSDDKLGSAFVVVYPAAVATALVHQSVAPVVAGRLKTNLVKQL